MDDQKTRKPPQSPICRKAYAIMERLEWLHWDNCKVRFGKQGARAYAEQALNDGHLEGAIISAYAAALSYCHGLTTDEMDNGKRARHDKATPALTIDLARRRLECDGKTPNERWDFTVTQLEKRRQEVTKLSAEATAWFAKQHAAMTSPPPSPSNASVPVQDIRRASGPSHPAHGDGTAAERPETDPATHSVSARSFSRPVVVAPLSLREIGFPTGTDDAVPDGKPITRMNQPIVKRRLNRAPSGITRVDAIIPRNLPLRVVEWPRLIGRTVSASRCSNRASVFRAHSTIAPRVAHHQPSTATGKPSPMPFDHAPSSPMNPIKNTP
jgi:hypothetical protein